MRILIVDDEPLARRRLVRMIEAFDEHEVAGEAASGVEAREKLRELAPDVVLLDIRMPELDGLALVREEGSRLPPIVFTTAYDEYALEAFDVEAVDYVLKPVEPERLRRALDRVQARRERDAADRLERLVRRLAPTRPPRLVVRRGRVARFLDPRAVTSLHAAGALSELYVGGERHLLDDTLRELERRLVEWGFLRVHRSTLVNLRHVVGFRTGSDDAQLLLSDGRRVEVSRRRRAAVRERLGLRSDEP